MQKTSCLLRWIRPVSYTHLNEIDKVANGIIDGSIESAEVKGNNSIAFPLSEAGKYTVVAVTYNENEEVQLHNACLLYTSRCV